MLAGAAVVFLTGVLARELGGGRFAQFLAAAAILFAPAYLAFDSFLSMNAFEPLFWLVCAWIAVRIVQGRVAETVARVRRGRRNRARKQAHDARLRLCDCCRTGAYRARGGFFVRKWIWIGGADRAGDVFCRILLWEARHGWPQIEVVRNAQLYKNVPISPLRFLGEQIAFLDPLALPVWLGGLGVVFFRAGREAISFLGWTYLIVLAIFMFFGGKSYYALPVYPLLMAAGGVAFEEFCRAARAALGGELRFPRC